jgi:hypothetical protein
VSIIKDTTRATSAIAHVRSTLLTIDKNTFMSMVDSDKIVQLNQREDFSDDSLLGLIRHVKGGPASVVKTVYSEHFPNRVVKLDTRARLVRSGRAVSPKSRTGSPKSSPGHIKRSPGKVAAAFDPDAHVGGVAAVGGATTNDGAAHTWLDVVRAIHQAQVDNGPDAEALLRRDEEAKRAAAVAEAARKKKQHSKGRGARGGGGSGSVLGLGQEAPPRRKLSLFTDAVRSFSFFSALCSWLRRTHVTWPRV